MKNRPAETESTQELRMRAEEKLRSQEPSTSAAYSPEETAILLHELRVHQIELEMQNTELRRLQHDLETTKASYFDLYELAPVGYLTVNERGAIQKANLAAASIFNVVRENLLNKPITKLIFREDQTVFYLQRNKISDENEVQAWDMRLVRADGSSFWVHLQAAPVHNGEYLVTFNDITERKRSEEERQKLEQQFQQAQKLESLGILAGGIAHDFNNILSVIICNCSLLQQRPAMVAELVPEIDIAAQRAAGLCRQMLIYAGKAQPVPTEFNVKTLVEEMVKMLKATINQNVTITLDLSTDIPPIKADASQIRQVVMNLIINASEAIGTEQGNITVTLAIAAIEADPNETDYLGKVIPPGSYIRLKVTDNGCGMDEGTKQRLFEPFYTTKVTGRGLGMSAVLGIIKAHNGALQLTSHIGFGTTFKVYLPVQSSEPVGDLLPHVSLMPWQGSGTVLLVEDEPQLSGVAKALIQALGFSIFVAENGQIALEMYQKNAEYITLVLTDIGMPVMDGYELISELKKLNPELPIIVSSGFGDAEVTSRIRENIAGCVSKPYSFDQLREVLRGVVEGTKSSPK